MAMSQINPEDTKMKFNMKTLVALLALAAIAATAVTALAEFGSGAVKEGETYTTQEMLTYAIQDEYMALAEYEAIVAAYGDGNPFSNLIEAEKYHVTLLTGLFEAYGYAVPANDAANRIALPESLDAAYDVGAEAETNNIAMYETFLAQDVPADVAQVFSALKDASGNHLAAFQQAGGRSGMGGMRGNSRWSSDDETDDATSGYRSGSCVTDDRRGGNRNDSSTRGNGGCNRDNCPCLADDTNP
jgi:hypothetical protein